MRICHVTPHLPPDQGANAILPAQLGAWQRARGDVVSFVTHGTTQGGTRQEDPSIVVLPRRRGNRLARLLRLDAMAVARAVNAALAAQALNPSDVLHLHSNGVIVEAAARFARGRGIPYVLTLYGTEIWHYRARKPVDLFTAAYRGASAVTFYSSALKARAVELGLDRSNLVVVFPAVADMFQPQDAATRARCREELGITEARVILNVKRLHELAGQRFLLEAFATIARDRSDVRLVICGTGSLRDALEEQSRALGIADRVTFTGLLLNDQIARYSAVADVFALPSLLEALPTVAVEALAAGTPVVSADHPGGLELHGLFGDDVAIVPKEDAPALAAALSAVLDAPRRVSPSTLAGVDRLFRPNAVLAAYDAAYASARSSHQSKLS
jgi:glycosyltransferase involved in cell wall biosynthesis